MATPADDSVGERVIYIDGPWQHRDLSAGGTRFHVAEVGRGPLVLLLHGFPEFWWCWRHQLVGLADAGFHAVAPDLRGYGASDKPPRGYDAPTLAADVAGMVRALGHRDAVVVGHDWGGLIGWAVAGLHPDVVRRLVVVSIPHPRRMRATLLTDPRGQGRASWYFWAFQLPGYAERRLTDSDAAFVGQLLHEWGGPGFPDAETERRVRAAIQVPGAAHCALEYYRWAVRSLARPSGLRFLRRLRRPVDAPTLQLHGALDRCILPTSAQGSGRYVAADYDWRLLPGVGHFPPEEAPAVVTAELIRWAQR